MDKRDKNKEFVFRDQKRATKLEMFSLKRGKTFQ